MGWLTLHRVDKQLVDLAFIIIGEVPLIQVGSIGLRHQPMEQKLVYNVLGHPVRLGCGQGWIDFNLVIPLMSSLVRLSNP